MKPDGGPAFPLPLGTMNAAEPDQSGGMTLRDYFIAHAPASEIDGMVPVDVGSCAKYLGIEKYENDKHYLLLIAKCRCQWADAMLAERERGK